MATEVVTLTGDEGWFTYTTYQPEGGTALVRDYIAVCLDCAALVATTIHHVCPAER